MYMELIKKKGMKVMFTVFHISNILKIYISKEKDQPLHIITHQYNAVFLMFSPIGLN